MTALSFPQYPPTLPGGTVIGRMAPTPGPSEAIPISSLATALPPATFTGPPVPLVVKATPTSSDNVYNRTGNAINVFDGQAGNAETNAANPSVYISRLETNSAGFGASVTNGALVVNGIGVADGLGGAQLTVIGSYGFKDPGSQHDIAAINTSVQHKGTNGTAFGGFFAGTAIGTGTFAMGVELACGAANGQSISYTGTAVIPGYYGIDNSYSGSNFAPTALTSISNASPAVFTLANHGLIAGQRLMLTTTGTLPSPLATATPYYVLAAGLTSSTFQVSTSPGGSPVNTGSAGSGTHSYSLVANATAAMMIRTYTSDGNTDHAGQFDVGIGFMNQGQTGGIGSNLGPIHTASIQSDDNAINMWLGNSGAHTNGLNWAALTFAGNAIGTPGFTVDGAGNATTKSVTATAVTYANRPITPVEGMIVAMTDSTVNTWGSAITVGGGANHVLAYYNGTNWKVIGA